jgi:hypothetical protein
MAFLTTEKAAYRTRQDIVGFLESCDPHSFFEFLRELRRFTPFADLAVRRLTPSHRLSVLEGFEVLGEDGHPKAIKLAPAEDFHLSESDLDCVLFGAADGMDATEVDRVMAGVRARENPVSLDGAYYLEESGWGGTLDGKWWHADYGYQDSQTQALSLQWERDASLFRAHESALAYAKWKAQLRGSANHRDYEELDDTLAKIRQSQPRS